MTDTEEKIKKLADEKAVAFLEMDPANTKFRPEMFKILHAQATFGFRTKRELMLAQRAERDQAIRVVRMVFESPEKRLDYIQKSMPKLMIIAETNG